MEIDKTEQQNIITCNEATLSTDSESDYASDGSEGAPGVEIYRDVKERPDDNSVTRGIPKEKIAEIFGEDSSPGKTLDAYNKAEFARLGGAQELPVLHYSPTLSVQTDLEGRHVLYVHAPEVDPKTGKGIGEWDYEDEGGWVWKTASVVVQVPLNKKPPSPPPKPIRRFGRASGGGGLVSVAHRAELKKRASEPYLMVQPRKPTPRGVSVYKPWLGGEGNPSSSAENQGKVNLRY
jgi:hypothetical protein